jgi:drug/metabolite transporter (DMT)-like permease
MCISIPLNCLLSYFFFQEKLTKQIMIGSFIIVTGVIWVSLTKGKAIQATNDTTEIISESDIMIYRLISISAAVLAGFLNSMRAF